jgi:hypothetical protein
VYLGLLTIVFGAFDRVAVYKVEFELTCRNSRSALFSLQYRLGVSSRYHLSSKMQVDQSLNICTLEQTNTKIMVRLCYKSITRTIPSQGQNIFYGRALRNFNL